MGFFRSDWSSCANSVSICQIFGSYCALCARPGQPGIDLCASCQAWLRPTRYTSHNGRTTVLCPGCGVQQNRPRSRQYDTNCTSGADAELSEGLNAIYNASTIDDFCPNCVDLSGQFLSHIVAPYRYAFPIDAMIKRLKYQQDRQLARVFGTLLARHVSQRRRADLPEILLPMPLHASRLQARGFNQAQDIARWCGKTLGIGVQAGRLSRIVDTGSLAGLSRLERQHRILGAFRADDTLAGQRVAIIDDVLTTGASARELAREIYDCGADSVELWVLARTSSSRTSD